ncbi:MAG TPA: hypothetical protein VN108_01500, partial [Marmoricola sp.]|nr:hypothetical protein [Marmoricola sp.]
MRAWVVRQLFERFGRRCWYVFALIQGAAGALVASVTSLAMASFWRPPLHTLIEITALAGGLAGFAVMVVSLKPARVAGRFWEWNDDPNAPDEETIDLWNFASSAIFRNFRNHSALVLLIAVVPACAFAAVADNTGWAGFGAMVFA